MNLFQVLADNTDFCTSAAGYKLFGFVGHIFRIIQIAVPIIIILMGTIDLVKAVVAQKPDEMKKAQSILIKRLIIGVAIFFVPMIVNFLVNLVGGNTTSPCLSCVLNNPGDCVEIANNMNKNSSNNGNSGNIPSKQNQPDNEAKNTCEKCEKQGKKCVENAGKYRCVESMYN